MRYVEEFRDPKAAKGVLAAIARVACEIGATREEPVRIMEICGGHTHAIFRYGLDKLVHEGIEFIHGPGCPVCVTPLEMIDRALEETGRNVTQTARRLGISRKSLQTKMKELGLRDE